MELTELNDFTYPGSIPYNFADNYQLTNTSVTGEVGDALPGYFAGDAPFPAGVIFRNDILRTDDQIGIFGEATYDFNDAFSLTFGLRYYDIEVDFEGSANGSFFNKGAASDAQVFGTNISAQFGKNSTVGAPDKAVADGTIFKVTADWKPTDDQMYYLTVSEGFRPGLFNRPGGRSNPAMTFTVPFVLDTDDVTNVELGVKADYGDRLRLNAAAFMIDIESLQTTIFDPNIVNLFFSDNAADAEVRGIEGDFIWLPTDALTVSGAFSFLDTEITKVLTPTNDVVKGDELAFAPSFQGNLRARYEFDVGSRGWIGHFMPSVSYSGNSFSDIITINRDKIGSATMLNLTTGLTADNWSAEVFWNNIADKRAEVSRNFVFDVERVTYAQPRTIGVRLSIDF